VYFLLMKENATGRRSVLLSFRFIGTALVGSLTMALVSAFAPPPAQLAVLGALVSILGGLFVSYVAQEEERDRRRAEALERLAVALTLAPEDDLYPHYLAYCRSLTALAAQTDPLLREIAALKLASVNAQIGSIASGTVVFAGTETWRAVYEQLLAGATLRQYRSVAWVRSADYWQDAPGRQSMRANFEAAHRGLLIERIVVLPDALWPGEGALPAGTVWPWLKEQHDHGLHLVLVRESAIAGEPDLLADFGIYGDRAVGTLETDERSRPVRFTLSFDPQAVRLADDRWRRLSIFGVPFQNLLETPAPFPSMCTDVPGRARCPTCFTSTRLAWAGCLPGPRPRTGTSSRSPATRVGGCTSTASSPAAWRRAPRLSRIGTRDSPAGRVSPT
jgi:hypothetical protein